jgi:hypothetical protein
MSKRPREPKILHPSASTKELFKLCAAAGRMKASRTRHSAYHFLSVVYRTYWRWSERRIAHKKIKALAAASSVQYRKHHHAFRTMLDAADCSPEAKVLSRWTRAMEYALDMDINPGNLQHFLKRNGGIAGCGRLAAKRLSKRRHIRNDWL